MDSRRPGMASKLLFTRDEVVSQRHKFECAFLSHFSWESKITLFLTFPYPTTFILDGSQSSFSRSLYLLDSFALISGLKVNYEKTEALWISSCKSSEITLPSLKPILWVHVSFLEKIDKLQSILNSWSERGLSWAKSP